ncbi:methyltransferase domain-containing protein [Streptomyces sp. NPDC047014]|uniref:class I SAM-dependent methyltransferase n=1 Tax=Streptomyces sp. NPDC047014 TaxID=3155736 RepID=UPI0033FF0839
MTVVVVRDASTGAAESVCALLATAGLTARPLRADEAAPPGITGLILLSGAPAPALVREALAADVPVLALGAGTEPLGELPRAGRSDRDAADDGSDPRGALLRFAGLVAERAERTATRAFFTRRADAWEERFAYQTPAYEAAVARMRLAPGRRALDLGCGTGRAMPALRSQVGPEGQVLGVDLTPAMLAAAARHGRTRHGQLLAGDCTRLPLADASVHGIFAAGLVDHVPDPRAALREWARITAPDGTLLLFHPSGRAERAARHGRPLDPHDLLAEPNLRPALESTGWHLDTYEDAPNHFLARAVPSR